jgi:hypothetical protein
MAGWSILEVVLVLGIGMILLITAVPRFRPLDTTVGLEADRVRNDLRLMQTLAVAWGAPLRFVPVAGGYSFQCPRAVTNTPCTAAGAAPATGAANRAGLATVSFAANTAESGISINPVPGTNLEVDSMGRPSSSCSTTCALLVTVPAYSVTLSGGGTTTTVNVTRISGLVQ